MIVCKLEMWPGGDESRKYAFGSILIANVGGNAECANYDIVIMKSPTIAKNQGIWKRGKVKGFNRRKMGPQDLLLRALIACIGDRSMADVAKVQGEGPQFGEEPLEVQETRANA